MKNYGLLGSNENTIEFHSLNFLWNLSCLLSQQSHLFRTHLKASVDDLWYCDLLCCCVLRPPHLFPTQKPCLRKPTKAKGWPTAQPISPGLLKCFRCRAIWKIWLKKKSTQMDFCHSDLLSFCLHLKKIVFFFLFLHETFSALYT